MALPATGTSTRIRHVPSLVDAVRDFVADLTGARAASAKTAKEYRNHLLGFARDVAQVLDVDVQDVPLDVSRSTVSAALSAWRFAPDHRFADSSEDVPSERAPLTVRRRVTVLRAFYDWCVEDERLERSPAAKLKAPKVPVQPPRRVEQDEAVKVLAAAQSGRVPSRDLLLVALHMSCGLSLREVSELTMHSVHGDPPTTLTVQGRTGRRTVALSPLARQAFVEYLPARERLLGRYGAQSDRLLLSWRPRKKGVHADGTPILKLEPSRESLGEALGRVLERAGVSERGLGSQGLRVAFAQAALTSGSHTVFALQAQLGHATLTPLRTWVSASEAELTASMAAHPIGSVPLHGDQPV